MTEVVRLSDRRSVIHIALSICLRLDHPYRRDYPWAAMGVTLDDVYRVIEEEREGQQLLLPLAS